MTHTVKTKITGFTENQGISNKTNKPFHMCFVHELLAIHENEGKGFQSVQTYVEPDVLQKIKHLEFPLDVEMTFNSVVRYGKQQQVIQDIKPLKQTQIKAA